MNLEDIINVVGKSGLYKVVSRAKNTVIVKSLIDGKKSPIHTQQQANMLKEIGIYTYNDTMSLSDIFDSIAKKKNYKKTISHKKTNNELTTYFREIIPDYDEERVYISDIKKVIQWYNALYDAGLIKEEEVEDNKEKNTLTNNKK